MSVSPPNQGHAVAGPDVAAGRDQLPTAQRVLAVCAHPDDETFGLGALLAAFAQRTADVALLTLTRGEATTSSGDRERLARQRTVELACATEQLGIARSSVHSFPDGRLREVAGDQVLATVQLAIDEHDPDLLLVFDPAGITGHPDHQQATEATLLAACGADVPVLGWYVPTEVALRLNGEFAAGFVPTTPVPGDLHVGVDRAPQIAAMVCHGSQRDDLAVVSRMVELLGDGEHLRALTRTTAASEARHRHDHTVHQLH